MEVYAEIPCGVSLVWQGHFDLVIKVYPGGNVSQHMFSLKVGDMVEVRL